MQPYRLGIDIGTASAACAAFALDRDGRPAGIIHCAVRIFEEPLQPAKSGGVGEPKKAARRLARQQRRQHQRRAARLRNVAALGAKIGANPAETPPDPGQTIHKIRATAATETVPLPDLLRVFLHLAKRRGYMGVFREPKEKKPARKKSASAENTEPTRGQVREGVDKLRAEIADGTLGEYLLRRIRDGRDLRLKTHGLYADKAMVEDEFGRVWKTQAAAHPTLRDGGGALREEFHEAIFYKRPLRSPAPMVGNCELYPDLPRAPMAQPAFQEFRMEHAIGDLAFVAAGARRREFLSSPQQDIVRNLLRKKREVKFAKMAEEMRRAGCPPPDGMDWTNFNFAKGGFFEAWKKGDNTVATMKKFGLAEEWAQLDGTDQTVVINLLAERNPEEFQSSERWRENIPCGKRRDGEVVMRKIPDRAADFIDAMVKSGKLDRLSKMGFDSGRAAYSVKALRQLTALMRDKGCNLHEAIEHVREETSQKSPQEGKKRGSISRLPPPPQTGNTVVDVALRQIRWAVNQAIDKLASEGWMLDQVVVELSRDVARSLDARGKIAKANKRMEAERDKARERIAAHRKERGVSGEPSRRDIKRFLLWQEQDERWCPYCTSAIRLGEALDERKTETDHILPRSATRITGRRDFLVLVHKDCHEAKGQDKTPWQAWGDGRDNKRWEAVKNHAEQFRANKKFIKASQLLHEGDALDAEALEKFSDRQFAETSWIGKICAAWLREICGAEKTLVSRGQMTAYLRHCWGLDRIIPELRYEAGLPVLEKKDRGKREEISPDEFRKNPGRADKRVDHRHHMIDAIVIGLTDRSLFQRMTRLYQQRTESGQKGFGDMETPLMPVKGLPELARKFAADISNISHRPDRRPAGPFFDDMPYAARVDDKGVRRYAQRVDLAKLVGVKDTAKQARRKIQSIVDPQVRDAVLDAFEKRIAAGAKPGAALHETVSHPVNGTPIRRVLRVYNAEVKKGRVVEVEHSARDPKNPGRKKTLRKILKPRTYAYLEVRQRDGKLQKPETVHLHKAARAPKRLPKGAVRFYKNDVVCGPATNGIPHLVRGIKDRDGLVLTPITEAREVKEFRAGVKMVGDPAKLLALEILNG